MNQYFTNNNNLKDENIIINYNINNHEYSFFSNSGVFSKHKIDYASILLVNAFLKNHKIEGKRALDIGCGYGFIGIVLAHKLGFKFDMVDVNNRALELCKKNNKLNGVNNKIYESNCFSEINESYDLIITNPPIRAGKKVVLNILEGAKKHLKEKGELWFVINKNQGANSIKKVLEKIYLIEIKAKSKGFYVFCAKIVDKSSTDC